jgi:alcohol dehydrogenase (NADP+)
VVPKAAQEIHLRDNLSVKKLPDDDFQAINTLASRNGGPKRFLDPKEYLGFDVFDEEQDQPVADAAPWDAPQQ